MASALAQAGEHDRAVQVADDAEQVAHGLGYPAGQARALACLAGAFTQAGEHVRADQVAAEATQLICEIYPATTTEELVDVASALAQAGQHARAEEVAARAVRPTGAISDPVFQAQALANVARARI